MRRSLAVLEPRFPAPACALPVLANVPFQHPHSNVPLLLVLAAVRSQGLFRQLHVSATTHKVSTRPTCSKSVGYLTRFPAQWVGSGCLVALLLPYRLE